MQVAVIGMDLGLKKKGNPKKGPPEICNNIYLLFVTGKLEIGTKLADFCSRALLALDVLAHPRALSLEKAVPVGSGLNYSTQGKTFFGGGTYRISAYRDQPQAMEIEDMYDDWLASTKDDEPAEAPVNDSAAGTSKAGTMLADGSQLNPIADDPKINPPRITSAAQDAPARWLLAFSMCWCSSPARQHIHMQSAAAGLFQSALCVLATGGRRRTVQAS